MISKLERLLSGGTVTWDRLLVTDGLSPEAVEQITAVSPAAPDRVWVVIDHDSPCLRRSWPARWRAGRSPCPRLRRCGWR